MKHRLPLSLVATALLASGASAADLPRRAAPPPVFAEPAFTWTGFYAGLNAGYGAASDTVRNTAPPAAGTDAQTILTELNAARLSLHSQGFVGGGQLGYNHQFTPGSGVVLGIEADAQYADLSRRRSWKYPWDVSTGDVHSVGRHTLSVRTALDYLGTVRGRLGYAFDRVLIYGTGGFAYGQTDYGGTFTTAYTNTFTINGTTGTDSDGTSFTAKSKKLQTGYAYGGGIEYALPGDSFLNFFKASAVTLRAEYLHFDLGQRSLVAKDSDVDVSVIRSKVRNDGDIGRVGLSYKFGSY